MLLGSSRLWLLKSYSGRGHFTSSVMSRELALDDTLASIRPSGTNDLTPLYEHPLASAARQRRPLLEDPTRAVLLIDRHDEVDARLTEGQHPRRRRPVRARRDPSFTYRGTTAFQRSGAARVERFAYARTAPGSGESEPFPLAGAARCGRIRATSRDAVRGLWSVFSARRRRTIAGRRLATYRHRSSPATVR
jgi:hypothetical protein